MQLSDGLPASVGVHACYHDIAEAALVRLTMAGITWSFDNQTGIYTVIWPPTSEWNGPTHHVHTWHIILPSGDNFFHVEPSMDRMVLQ